MRTSLPREPLIAMGSAFLDIHGYTRRGMVEAIDEGDVSSEFAHGLDGLDCRGILDSQGGVVLVAFGTVEHVTGVEWSLQALSGV